MALNSNQRIMTPQDFLKKHGQYSIRSNDHVIAAMKDYAKQQIAKAFDEGRKAEKMKSGVTGELYAHISQSNVL